MADDVKLAFFDVDGVLSAPRYWTEDGEYVIGFSDQGWVDFCEKEGEDAYKLCDPIPGVTEYIEKLKSEGAKLFVLSTTASKAEISAKIKYLDRLYLGDFLEYYFVDHDLDKIEKIKEVAEREGVKISECALIEDTLNTLFIAHDKGIKAVHISNILADNISR